MQGKAIIVMCFLLEKACPFRETTFFCVLVLITADPGLMKRGGCGKRCTAGRIVRGGGDGGIPSGVRPGGLRISLAVWLIEVSRNVCLGGPGLVCTQ